MPSLRRTLRKPNGGYGFAFFLLQRIKFVKAGVCVKNGFNEYENKWPICNDYAFSSAYSSADACLNLHDTVYGHQGVMGEMNAEDKEGGYRGGSAELTA